jgi:hypothetical protein
LPVPDGDLGLLPNAEYDLGLPGEEEEDAGIPVPATDPELAAPALLLVLSSEPDRDLELEVLSGLLEYEPPRSLFDGDDDD